MFVAYSSILEGDARLAPNFPHVKKLVVIVRPPPPSGRVVFASGRHTARRPVFLSRRQLVELQVETVDAVCGQSERWQCAMRHGV